jgi:hypothetical protein
MLFQLESRTEVRALEFRDKWPTMALAILKIDVRRLTVTRMWCQKRLFARVALKNNKEYRFASHAYYRLILYQFFSFKTFHLLINCIIKIFLIILQTFFLIQSSKSLSLLFFQFVLMFIFYY